VSQEIPMTATIQNLSRYPIKGSSPEMLRSIELHPGRGFLGDRAFALELPGTEFDEVAPKPLSKFMFLMLARQAQRAYQVEAASGCSSRPATRRLPAKRTD
jgi:uncharacterized protein YcbX